MRNNKNPIPTLGSEKINATKPKKSVKNLIAQFEITIATAQSVSTIDKETLTATKSVSTMMFRPRRISEGLANTVNTNAKAAAITPNPFK